MSAKLQLKESETELKQTQSKFSESSESCTNLKNLLEATQQVNRGSKANLQLVPDVT